MQPAETVPALPRSNSLFSNRRMFRAGPSRTRFVPLLALTICTMAVSIAEAQTVVRYAYDGAGRLIEASYGAGARISYQYDAAGNLLSRTISVGTSALYLPYYQAGGDIFLGIALVNYSTTPANIEFTAFGKEGSPLAFARNPSALTLEPYHQVAKLGSELFGTSGSAAQAGWILLTTDNPELGAFFESANYSLTQVDGSTAQFNGQRKLFFSRVMEGKSAFRNRGVTTFLSVANPGPDPATVRLKLMVPDSPGSRAVHQAGPDVVRGIAGHGVLYGSVPEIFGSTPASGGYIILEVTEGDGVVGFELLRVTARPTIVALNAQPGGSSGSNLYSAQLASGSTIFTSLKLINTSEESRTLTLRAIANTGSLLAPALGLTLGPGEYLEEDADKLFLFAAPFVVGSLHVQADGAGIVGDVVFGEPANLQFASSMPLQKQLFTKAVLNQVANGMGLYTGVGLYNPGSQTAAITLHVYSQQGGLTGTRELRIGPGQRLAELVSELVPSTAGQVTGFIVLQSDQPLIAQQFFGDLRANMLSAVPPSVIE